MCNLFSLLPLFPTIYLLPTLLPPSLYSEISFVKIAIGTAKVVPPHQSHLTKWKRTSQRQQMTSLAHFSSESRDHHVIVMWSLMSTIIQAEMHSFCVYFVSLYDVYSFTYIYTCTCIFTCLQQELYIHKKMLGFKIKLLKIENTRLPGTHTALRVTRFFAVFNSDKSRGDVLCLLYHS